MDMNACGEPFWGEFFPLRLYVLSRGVGREVDIQKTVLE
jgi:hypothetical protein